MIDVGRVVKMGGWEGNTHKEGELEGLGGCFSRNRERE